MTVTGMRSKYGFKFFLNEENWLSLASWNHIHDAAPETLPSENVEVGLNIGASLTCWRLDVEKVGELLVVWKQGNFVDTVEFLEAHGELLS